MTHSEMKELNMNRVVEKALELFYEKGIANTKITDIAKAANLVPTSVYRYFGDKDTIVMHTIILFARRYYEGVVNHLQQIEFQDLTGLEQYKAISRFYIKQIKEHKRFLLMTNEFERHLSMNGILQKGLINDEQANQALHTAFSVGLNCIKKGIVDGTIRDDKDPQELFEIVMTAGLGTMQKIGEQYIDWNADSECECPEYLLEGCFDMLLSYLKKNK